jgi:hypothetical protein
VQGFDELQASGNKYKRPFGGETLRSREANSAAASCDNGYLPL